ncbi:MAG TPA: AsnC family transcriptional regulator [Syntrophomonadaceae bacterium]|nr:AsnC family transcriptional regulator [Syntrophomonadaceae bacterium]
MDKLDRQILDILQENYPLEINPYALIAGELGITEAEVLKRIGQLKDDGIIRRIGAIIDARSMGFYSTLCATTVSEDRIEEVAKIINQRPEVTHNYIREHELNIWFTLTASSHETVLDIIRDLEKAAKIEVFAMPAQKTYKIRVALEMGDSK